MREMRKDRCRGCGAPVYWIQLPSGKWMILEEKVLVIYDTFGMKHTGREPHWGRCPEAKQFKTQ